MAVDEIFCDESLDENLECAWVEEYPPLVCAKDSKVTVECKQMWQKQNKTHNWKLFALRSSWREKLTIFKN